MKITDQNSMRPTRSEVKKTDATRVKEDASSTTPTVKAPQTARVTDHLELSTGREQMEALKSGLEETPDIREDVVASIREEIGAGTYWSKRTPQAIVSSMLEHFKKYE